jgi:energy-coupling factor transporter ATP-binding protein EcfA2
MTENLIDSYLRYTSDSESPAIFHRWSLLTCLAAYLARDIHIQHGHFTIYPNLYTLLIGSAGSRKSSAINIAKGLLKQSGYSHFSPTKTTKEKFFIDMAEHSAMGAGDVEDFLEQNLFGDRSDDTNSISEMFIVAGEFNTFFGNNILDFVTDLGELWDYNGRFESKVKNSKSVQIMNPTINILGGNTPTGFSAAFPIEILGQGFFSRTLMIFGERTRAKITWPEPPDAAHTAELLSQLREIKLHAISAGSITLSQSAKDLLDVIYKSWKDLDDARFESYSNRRFTHLLKLCMITAAMRLSSKIEPEDVVYANTVLSYAEHFMPKALGEFGKAKHADVAHKVLQALELNQSVMSITQLWKSVHNDLDKPTELATILENLVRAEKVQAVPGGFIPRRKAIREADSGLMSKVVNFNLLSTEEKESLI